MKWTKELVIEELNTNPNFKSLSDEWQGVFILRYKIKGNMVLLCNTVNGVAEVFIVPPFNKATIYDVCDFAIIAKEILNERINTDNL